MRKIWTPTIILPSILKEDERLTAAAAALEKELASLSTAALECLFLPRLSDLPTAILDILANQYHVDFFEPTMSDEDKRALIRDAIQWHRRKGTPVAVEEVARKIYADAHVREWYEYDGKPFFFRLLQDITATDELTDRETLDRLRAAVAESKNTRSWVEFYGFLITFEDAIDPTDNQTLNVNKLIIDEYDYRRNNALYDGTFDEGVAWWKHNGRYTRNGSFNRKGYESRIRHGHFQATDFEVMSFVAWLTAKDAVEPVEHIINRISFNEAWLETFNPTDDISVDRVLHIFTDRFQTIDLLVPPCPINIITREPIDTPAEWGVFLLHQKITHNRKLVRNGAATHCGSLTAVQTFITPEELDAWTQLRDHLARNYREPCKHCGYSYYEFRYGSARIGSQQFLISDPQLLTVDIYCVHCGALLHQYLVEDHSWEVLL